MLILHDQFFHGAFCGFMVAFIVLCIFNLGRFCK